MTELNWKEAESRLEFYLDAYSSIPTGMFGYTKVMRLHDKFQSGDRSQNLYDEIMELE